jgi:hypothetical protein
MVTTFSQVVYPCCDWDQHQEMNAPFCNFCDSRGQSCDEWSLLFHEFFFARIHVSCSLVHWVPTESTPCEANYCLCGFLHLV